MSDNKTDIPFTIHTPTSERIGERIQYRVSLEPIFYVIEFYDMDDGEIYSSHILNHDYDFNRTLNRSLRDKELKKNNNIIINTKPVPNEKENDCSICFEKIEIGEKIFDLDCKHVFHEKCLSNWVKYKQDCPVCRDSIKCINTSNAIKPKNIL